MSKAKKIKFIDKNGQWVVENCHDILTCREHRKALERTNSLLNEPNDVDDVILSLPPMEETSMSVEEYNSATEEELELISVEVLQEMVENRKNIMREKDLYHNKADWNTFQLAMRLLNPQSYGAQFETRIIKAYGWSKLASKERKGDASFIEKGEVKNTEIKVTLINEDAPKANIVQIREDHNMDYYDIFVVRENGSTKRFRLTKKQMAEELEITGKSLAHGTQGNQDGESENAEFRIDFFPVEGDATYARWNKKYLMKNGEKPLVGFKP
jgi:hypothetical protein